ATMRFFQHVLSLCEIERTGQLDAWLERFDAANEGVEQELMEDGTMPARDDDGASLLDSMLVFPRVHAAIDVHLATARGPWSDGLFVSAVLPLLASAPERAA
ncbi:MAG TPA: hypothetical protein VIH21_06750, partial [Dehalococcoidia bacterium]